MKEELSTFMHDRSLLRKQKPRKRKVRKLSSSVETCLHHIFHKIKLYELLRMVPSFVTAHTLRTSQDTWVSYGGYLLIQGYFSAG